MAIFVTGDTHGSQSRGFFSCDGFMRRFDDAAFPEQAELDKADYVVVCGDFGGVWSVDRLAAREDPQEARALDWLEGRPFTTLFIPGNHENYDRLTGCSDERLLDSWFYAGMPDEEKDRLRQGYPRVPWHGGHVRRIRPSVLMLERGDLFVIDGKTCLAFGGARSHDIQDGILDPCDYPDEAAFKRDYARRRDGMIRVKGVSWWAAEMPTRAEMDRCLENVREFMARHDRIDFVFTHDAPASDKLRLGYEGIDDLNRFFDALQAEMRYDRWFYGHLHDNCQVTDRNWLLYEQIVRIN